ncbi:uridine kinase family protein [Vacuolonema iberomarrocanum]|uniref:uridine kinase family protein n=1 Tax=Vacuolonema iberomarrocanum TaxID=3454632 RepID=UPI0019F4CAE1|nr:hypothetical protein [filamentous cyanobacterium LEGE 07170]
MNLIEIINSNFKGILGISGFGGSGKSTLAHKIAEFTDAPVIGIDSFFKHTDFGNCNNWDCVDFLRLKTEIIAPFRNGISPIKFREFDWENNSVGKLNEISHKGLIIIEGVGLFGSLIQSSITKSIWIDCPIEIAIARGKERDKSQYGVDNDVLWEGVWKQNDLESFEKYHPMEVANIIIDYKDLM